MDELLGIILGGTWNGCQIYLWKGDITTLSVDAIVNAANSTLGGGGGVDGAIHKAGGPAISEECSRIMQHRDALKVGEAVPTVAGNLKAKHVIHVLGPRYSKPKERDPALLAAAYNNALACARSLGATSIAFPCISTGIFSYPTDLACDIAINAVKKDLMEYCGLKTCIFCIFTEKDHEQYVKKFNL